MRRFPLTGYLIKRSLPGDVEDGAVLSPRDAEAHELCHHVRKLCHHVTLKMIAEGTNSNEKGRFDEKGQRGEKA